MNIVEVSNHHPVVHYLVELLTKSLTKNNKVLFLLSGGSCIPIAVDVARELRSLDLPLENLAISLTDERYGALGHADENWQQLLDAGLDLPKAKLYRVLQTGMNMTDTAKAYGEFLDTAIKTSDYRIGLFGIGADGHTAGIKAESIDMTTKNLTAEYDWDDYRRITTTPQAISLLDEAVAYAIGPEKAETLEQLYAHSPPIAAQPAQALKRVAKFTLFTDYKPKEK